MPRKFQDLGIIRAITQARKMLVKRNSEDLEFLVSRWLMEMQTFVASWGEFAPTLEDVVALTSLPLFGDAQIARFKLTDKDNKARHDALMQFLRKTKYGTSKKSTYLTWTCYFVDGAGKDSPFQLEALLAFGLVISYSQVHRRTVCTARCFLWR